MTASTSAIVRRMPRLCPERLRQVAAMFRRRISAVSLPASADRDGGVNTEQARRGRSFRASPSQARLGESDRDVDEGEAVGGGRGGDDVREALEPTKRGVIVRSGAVAAIQPALQPSMPKVSRRGGHGEIVLHTLDGRQRARRALGRPRAVTPSCITATSATLPAAAAPRDGLRRFDGVAIESIMRFPQELRS
jgi:hypothetical protein